MLLLFDKIYLINMNGVSRIDTPFLLYKESINMNSKISL